MIMLQKHTAHRCKGKLYSRCMGELSAQGACCVYQQHETQSCMDVPCTQLERQPTVEQAGDRNPLLK